MKRERKRHIPQVYESHGFYYFKVPVDGKRKTISTGSHTKKMAEDYRDEWLKASDWESVINPQKPLERKGSPRLLHELMELFLIPEQNPRYLEAKITGESYSDRRASAVARHMRQAVDAIGTYYKVMPLKKLTRLDMDTIRACIHREYGNTEKASSIWKSLVAVLNFAAQKGWLPISPAVGMKGIKPIKGKDKVVVDVDDFHRIYWNRDNFDSDLAQDIFYLLATTGLRHGEFAALQGKQFKTVRIDGEEVTVLNVNQAFKDDSYLVLGTPKWNLCRVLPLAPTTASIFKRYIRGKDDFLFPPNTCKIWEQFAYMRSKINTDGFDAPNLLETLSPHVMRHSLNTVLRIEDATDILIQEYLSWHHQDECKVQQGYTHIYVKSLMKISDKIESLYAVAPEGLEERDEDLITFD